MSTFDTALLGAGAVRGRDREAESVLESASDFDGDVPSFDTESELLMLELGIHAASDDVDAFAVPVAGPEWQGLSTRPRVSDGARA